MLVFVHTGGAYVVGICPHRRGIRCLYLFTQEGHTLLVLVHTGGPYVVGIVHTGGAYVVGIQYCSFETCGEFTGNIHMNSPQENSPWGIPLAESDSLPQANW